jgi:hypothetical protein
MVEVVYVVVGSRLRSFTFAWPRIEVPGAPRRGGAGVARDTSLAGYPYPSRGCLRC